MLTARNSGGAPAVSAEAPSFRLLFASGSCASEEALEDVEVRWVEIGRLLGRDWFRLAM